MFTKKPGESVDKLLELVAKLIYTKSLLKNQQNFYILDKIKNVTYVRMLFIITTATKEFPERNLNTDVYALFGKKIIIIKIYWASLVAPR